MAGPSRPPAPTPYDHFWSSSSSSAHPQISSIRRRLPHFPSAPLRIQRVSQLDAELLDEELTSMLLEPVKASLAQIKSTWPDRWQPELLALLKLVLFKYSIWDRGASYGAMLQNLRYRNEYAHSGGLQSTFVSAPLARWQLALYPLLTIAVPYAHEKMNRQMVGMSFSDLSVQDPRRVVMALVERGQRVYEGVALLNFLAFLGNGRYRTVTDRILGMRLTYAHRTLNRNVSFEFLNRQLVWHAFTEFLLFLLPIIRPRRLLRRLMRLPTHPRILAFWYHLLPYWLARQVGLSKDRETGKVRFQPRIPFTQPPRVQSSSDTTAVEETAGPYASLPAPICAICWSRIEADTSGASTAGTTAAATTSLGIPTSDPLDPSSGALAPTNNNRNTGSNNASNRTDTMQRLRAYHEASHAFGVSPQGIPYANALVHVPFAAQPCGCVYCYVCLAEKLLSEVAADELEDRVGNGAEGAWTCSRCNGKVKGMRRSAGEGEDEDEDEGEERQKQISSSPHGASDDDDDEVVDLSGL